MKLFGVIVGLTGYQDDSTLAVGDTIYIDYSTLSLKDEESSGKIIFNANTLTGTACKAKSDITAKFNDSMTDQAKYSDNAPAYCVDINLQGDNAVELFLFGSYTPDADSWLRNYSGNRIIFK